MASTLAAKGKVSKPVYTFYTLVDHNQAEQAYIESHKIWECNGCKKRLRQKIKDLSPTNLQKHLDTCGGAGVKEKYKRAMERFEHHKSVLTSKSVGQTFSIVPGGQQSLYSFFEKPQGGGTAQPPPPKKLKIWSFDKKVSDRELAKVIIEDNQTIGFAHSKAMRRFCDTLKKGFTPAKRQFMMKVSKQPNIHLYYIIHIYIYIYMTYMIYTFSHLHYNIYYLLMLMISDLIFIVYTLFRSKIRMHV